MYVNLAFDIFNDYVFETISPHASVHSHTIFVEVNSHFIVYLCVKERTKLTVMMIRIEYIYLCVTVVVGVTEVVGVMTPVHQPN